jgi:hypothetical protein
MKFNLGQQDTTCLVLSTSHCALPFRKLAVFPFRPLRGSQDGELLESNVAIDQATLSKDKFALEFSRIREAQGQAGKRSNLSCALVRI